MVNLRYAFVLCCLLLLAAFAGAVEYNLGKPIALRARVPAYTVTPGQAIHLSITYSDTDYVMGNNGMIREQIDDPIKLTYQATDGRLTPMTPANVQPVDLMWSSPVEPGYYAIVLTADDSGRFADDPPQRQIIEIAVQQDKNTPIIPTVRVGANPQTIQLDQITTTTVTAQLLGKNVEGKTVSFFSTAGTLSAATVVTDATGLAVVRLTAGQQDIGSVQVAAFYGNTTATTTVEVVARTPKPKPPQPPLPPPQLPGYQPDFLITVDPPSLPADGRSTAVVTVRVTDARGLGVLRKTVNFATTFGRIEPRAMTNRDGYASVRYYAPPTPGQGVITAQVDAQRSYTVVRIEDPHEDPTGPPRIFLTINPSTVLADGVTKILVETLVLDSDGYAIADAPIDFTSTLGTVQFPRVTTTKDGRAGTYVIASTTPGIAVVSARYGQISTASQVLFQGTAAAGTGLDLRIWSGQLSRFTAERWLFRQTQFEDGQQGAGTKMLQVFDTNGKVTKELDLGKTAKLILDQYGAAHGYATEENGKAVLNILRPDGNVQRTFSLDLPIGSQLVDLYYAEPSGHVLVTMANPDGSKPAVYFLSPDGAQLLSLRDGLESMPVTALGGDGYLAVALAGGTVRIYSPQGAQVCDARRTDGMPPAQIALGPAGEWVAIASMLAGQTETPGNLTVFSRQGTSLFNQAMNVTHLAPVDKNGVMIATTDSTRYLNLATRTIAWTMPGGYERFLAQQGMGIIAGQHDPKTQALLSRIVVVRISDGQQLTVQQLDDLRDFLAILPLDINNRVGVVTTNYTFRFPLPANK